MLLRVREWETNDDGADHAIRLHDHFRAASLNDTHLYLVSDVLERWSSCITIQ